MKCTYNFSAGPAVLPKSVMLRAQAEMIDWHDSGMSVMEMSHRGKHYMSIIEKVESDFRSLFNVPKNYKVLFLQGGAIAQNSMVPLNLLNGKKANYVVSGYWSKRSYQDALPFGDMSIAASSESIGYTKAPDLKEWKIDSSASYIHFCSNETIHGVEYFDLPSVKTIPVVADMSSHILSRPVDISQFGVIYAGAQKNIGPAGLTIVIVRDDLLEVASPLTPSVFNWKTQAENQSMINTPTTYSIYMAGLVFEWLIELGGLAAIEKQNIKKAELLYNYIDSSDFYSNPIDIKNRSRMNVPFRIQNEDLHASFVTGAENLGMIGLKGHRLVGGIRASIYNAMPIEGVQALVDYMKDFEKSH
ncbi:3-phosphoserine/phosphohydroxythreonine transaminase [Candidatus Methylopumilus universalis]|jgi:phosphoserine aminotransferase|uniref:Phosphoserine aminotransferase n=1 Tax=Candidatus Methylopumilus universalis TaxID=2588536 RepID=A0AAX1EZ28_9PROT|nr:3-phosphoserine/phosphohydroxythreonine transaminase [Candidatus Methylopumilus universalis]QDC41073.1 3-phosphoserine/phosphohydroxythreonine transaminase [Candidatus Methylopumilus universalis]QDC42363.1 3-phosphoserine/phosphohydroxythreonine transaminase [Candidatus Methylopumilus universalis]QDC54749.1 3-phosphoserine/phosphohydroxythreonine transaminase [Candidatus Methylopumilus universalis]QDC56030.1 3-phosphoserine/phosphohydroxythreonine transaminase [Candidatus Methylopumilus univ